MNLTHKTIEGNFVPAGVENADEAGVIRQLMIARQFMSCVTGGDMRDK